MLPGVQALHGFAEREVFYPGFFLIFLVADLVHDIEGVSAVCDNGFIEAHGILDGIQGIGDVFLGDADFGGDFFHGRLFQVLSGEAVSGIDCLIGGVLQGTGDTQAAVVPQEPSDFSDNHRNRVGGKFYIQRSVKIVYGFDESDAANLKQIVHIFVAGSKAFDNA